MCGALRSGLSAAVELPGRDLLDLGADGRSSPRRSGPARPGPRSRSARPSASRRPGSHRRRVEAEVDQPLGDVVVGDAGRLGERPDVEDALVGDQPVGAGVEHREVVAQPGGHVVGGEDRVLGRREQAVGAHQPHVGPRDRQDAGRAPRGAGDGRPAAAGVDQRVARQERHQVLPDADRADARAAAAVRDAERLVQVEVADVGAEAARLGEARPAR